MPVRQDITILPATPTPPLPKGPLAEGIEWAGGPDMLDTMKKYRFKSRGHRDPQGEQEAQSDSHR
jgi:hypothetical protein